MMIRVPSTVNYYPAGFGGSLAGLGDDIVYDPSGSGAFIDTTTDVSFDPSGNPISSLPPLEPVVVPPIVPITAPTAPTDTTGLGPGQAITPGTPTPAGGGLTAAQIAAIATAAGQAAINVAKATSTPGLIPGTNLVYNPATGQFLPGSGVGTPLGTQLAVTPTSLTASLSSSGALVIAIIAIGGILLFSSSRR
jgi:hypothetical protein